MMPKAAENSAIKESLGRETDLNKIKRELKREHRRLLVRRFFSNKLAASGALIVIFMVLCALLAPALRPEGPYIMTVSDRLLPPEALHPFGTDSFGRDLMARVLYGARISLLIGFSVSFIALSAGMVIGLYSAYYPSLDNVLMRVCDSFNAIPATLLAIALMAVLGANATNVIISLSVVYVPSIARIARASALSVKERTYIESMRALGARPWRIMWLHIAPNILGPIIVQASFIFANAIITEAALSFLGVGVPVPQPSLGNILYEGKTVLYKASWMVTFPGAFTAVTVLGLNMLGDGLRDLMDPRGH
jgi:peptide/nickel transport system permease protein